MEGVTGDARQQWRYKQSYCCLWPVDKRGSIKDETHQALVRVFVCYAYFPIM